MDMPERLEQEYRIDQMDFVVEQLHEQVAEHNGDMYMIEPDVGEVVYAIPGARVTITCTFDPTNVAPDSKVKLVAEVTKDQDEYFEKLNALNERTKLRKQMQGNAVLN